MDELRLKAGELLSGRLDRYAERELVRLLEKERLGLNAVISKWIANSVPSPSAVKGLRQRRDRIIRILAQYREQNMLKEGITT